MAGSLWKFLQSRQDPGFEETADNILVSVCQRLCTCLKPIWRKTTVFGIPNLEVMFGSCSDGLCVQQMPGQVIWHTPGYHATAWKEGGIVWNLSGQERTGNESLTNRTLRKVTRTSLVKNSHRSELILSKFWQKTEKSDWCASTRPRNFGSIRIISQNQVEAHHRNIPGIYCHPLMLSKNKSTKTWVLAAAMPRLPTSHPANIWHTSNSYFLQNRSNGSLVGVESCAQRYSSWMFTKQ